VGGVSSAAAGDVPELLAQLLVLTDADHFLEWDAHGAVAGLDQQGVAHLAGAADQDGTVLETDLVGSQGQGQEGCAQCGE
jgi:hypothetical protein